VKPQKTYSNSTQASGQGVFFSIFLQKIHFPESSKVKAESDESPCSHYYSFTGKEKDSETGFYYFGARYYDCDLSGLFLSVDPMADKYPSISPYTYCAWNPIKLVDPDGREVYITGDAAEQATAQLSSRGITVVHNEQTGKLSYFMTGKRLSKNDYRIMDAIDAENIIVNINATNNAFVPYEDISLNNTINTGQFLGVDLSDGDKRIANTQQLVNPNICANRDRDYCVPIGTSMLHELTESYEAGKICLETGTSCGPCWRNYKEKQINCPNDHVYYKAHENATLEAKYMSPIYKAKMNEINFKIANVISGVSRADWDKFSKILKR